MVGMALYVLDALVMLNFDALVMLYFKDILAVAFHGYALYRMYSGMGAFRRCGKSRRP
jgi:hypothetical protein